MSFQETEQLGKELEELRDDIAVKQEKLALIEKAIKAEQARTENASKAAAKVADEFGKDIDRDAFMKLIRKPYIILPQEKGKALVVVPKFIKDFQVGWLHRETESFWVFQLDQYSGWLSDLPKTLAEEIGIEKGPEASIDGDRVSFNPEQKPEIYRRLSRHLTEFTANSARIIKGHEFEAIAELVKAGTLPFKPRPIDKNDLRPRKGAFDLKNHQKPVIEKFYDTGAVGAFLPTGAGKSFTAMALCDALKGRKLIVVPTRMLLEQWAHYIETWIPHCRDEIDIVTYQGYRAGKEYTLVVFDECQRLPADTFVRLATVKAKYRLGLSASPHREDGREHYIFALTGYPVGLNWRDYMKETGRSFHKVKVHVVTNSVEAKLRKVSELLQPGKKTLIFSDSLELGERVAKSSYGPKGGPFPFVHGGSLNRLETVQNSQVVVLSRVGDLGMSIKDLSHVIEVDFLAGSRQQELQRTGRLMHSNEKDARHDIIMTRKELEDHGKRLWALQEKGFIVEIDEDGRDAPRYARSGRGF